MRDYKSAVKEILENLVAQKKVLDYSAEDIENSIIECRGIDPRTVKVWWRILWRFQYLVQPAKGTYRLNYEKVSTLEMKLPIEIDPKQTRLTATHTDTKSL